MRRKVWVSGPVIDIELGPPGSQAASETLQAIIDTGASAICTDSRVPRRLGLLPVNRKPMQIEDLDFNELVEIYGVPMSQPSRRVLLGRAFLRSFIVTYNGLEERFYYERSRPQLHGGYEEFDG